MLHKRILTVLLILMICAALCISVSAASAAKDDIITILFTHDLHSHLLPTTNDSGKGEYGGYARLMTLINLQRKLDPDAILVDGGDFSMGSLFQTAFATSALELRIMGAMGYDVTTFGNHEYDYLPSGLISMLHAAVESGDPLPALVCANYLPPVEGQEGYDAALWEAYNDYGVKKYTILERGGVYYAIFGIFGYNSHDCAPNSGMVFEEPAVVAQATVDAAVAECESTYGAHPVVICLSHSGTSGGAGEDYELAAAVNGIDVIVSGHTHSTLQEPIEVNNTLIVSATDYGRRLGVLKLKFDGQSVTLADYTLMNVTGSVKEDPTIAALIEQYKTAVEKDYLAQYGYTFDQVLIHNPYTFDTAGQAKATPHESTLCNVFSDAYKWAAERVTGRDVTIAVTVSGVIRSSLPRGEITVSDVFNTASLGVGTEGELVGVYLTGKDLRNAFELDASIQPLLNDAQLFISGAEYSFNQKRMFLNKVDYAMLRNDDGTLSEIDNDQLYFVVAGSYLSQMLGQVKKMSMGLISVTPRDAEGNPIPSEELLNYVIKDENGNPVKEWVAIADYLSYMGGEMDPHYAETDGRKVVYASTKPSDLLRHANIFTYAVLILGAVIISTPILTVCAIVRRRKKKQNQKG
jgi:2',3'-cyclic-nucleotide 2'-phosphodiesterase (5'-nucleotidase family)